MEFLRLHPHIEKSIPVDPSNPKDGELEEMARKVISLSKGGTLPNNAIKAVIEDPDRNIPSEQYFELAQKIKIKIEELDNLGQRKYRPRKSTIDPKPFSKIRIGPVIKVLQQPERDRE
jgi:hypothetical protein